MAEWSGVRYARTRDGSHLAYQEAGRGPPLLLLIEGFIPIDMMDDEPHLSGVLRRLASFSHAIRFDRRGIGLSDPATPESPPTLEQWLDDAETVLDAVSCREAAVFGDRGGALIAAAFAALRPSRVRSLVLVQGFARFFTGPDHPCGEDPAFIQNLRDRLLDQAHPEGPFDILRHLTPSVADDVRFRSWWDRAGRRGASPGTVQSLRHVIEHLDIRHLLPDIAINTLVVHRPGANFPHVGQSRLLAERIPQAHYVELAGPDSVWFVGETDGLMNEIERFLTGRRQPRATETEVLTVLFTDIVDSTARAAAVGDHAWTALFDRYEEAAHRHVSHRGGTYVKSTGDGSLAAFDGPIRALEAARTIRADAAELGLALRCGLHTGPVERRGHDISGMAVHVAARVVALAGPGEILLTRGTADLMAGAGIGLGDDRTVELKGVPGQWCVCAAVATNEADLDASG
jgi:class 3 adenylate cyclase